MFFLYLFCFYLLNLINKFWEKLYFGRVIFDGEFSNGYIIEGIKYGRDGNLEFILERNGIGKEYYDGYLKFEGIYLRGEKNGKGKS